MAAKTDAEKLDKIRDYCDMLKSMSQGGPPPDMTEADQIYYRAVGDGYYHAAETILNIIEHGTSRAPRTK